MIMSGEITLPMHLSKMADDGEIDIEGEFDFKLEVEDGFYDANELPSKSANLLPEFTNPPWMLEQGWTMDNYMDEKSKATIERMLMEEQQYMNGRSKTKILSVDKSPSSSPSKPKTHSAKRSWNDEEKQLFLKGLDFYGRSWTRISEIIPTRTSLQVKNYAQQYFKNLAKKSDNTSLEASSNLSSHHGQTPSTHTSSDPLSSVLVSVTTAQPTITSLTVSPSHGKKVTTSRPLKNMKNVCSKPDATQELVKSSINGLESVLPSASTIVGISGLQDIQCSSYTGQVDTSDLSPSVNLSGVGFLSGSKELGFDSSVGTLIHIASGLDTLAAVVESDIIASDTHNLSTSSSNIELSLANVPNGCEEILKANSTDSGLSEESPHSAEEEEEDIDIENDDDETPVLLGRSASPSSVYEKLLRSANVTPTELCETETSNQGKEPECKTETSDVSQCSSAMTEATQTRHEEDSDSSVSDSPAITTDLCSFSKPVERVNTVPKVEERVIVNGITTSSGETIEFPIPTTEACVHPEEISEEERKVHSEFFDGRQSKTPERYMKIRNHIIECWHKCKPNYLNKTSVRSGLKNCGDVNCIGRIHGFLESTGAINFGCEQTCYNNPVKTVVGGSKIKHSVCREGLVAVITEKVDSMRPRKRRIRDASGHWVDEKELEGKTIEHKALADKDKKLKGSKLMKMSYDPFKLIPCQLFSPEKPEPFIVTVGNTALAVMDIHSHISKTEVIGMLGGRFDTERDVLEIKMAVPCNSLSTGMQCEMDPVSQTQASEQISSCGLTVVGWYHSHPTFAPNPSIRDIETQLKFQDWFAKGGSHFVGIIVSPYNKLSSSLASEVKCLTIGNDVSQDSQCNLPYEFDFTVSNTTNDEDFMGAVHVLAEKYSLDTNRVHLSHQYQSSRGISCLSKMLESVRHHLLQNNSGYTHNSKSYDSALEIIKDTFTKLCSSETRTSSQEGAISASDDSVTGGQASEDVDTIVSEVPQVTENNT